MVKRSNDTFSLLIKQEILALNLTYTKTNWYFDLMIKSNYYKATPYIKIILYLTKKKKDTFSLCN